MWYAYVPRFAAIFLALMLTSVVVAPGSAWAQSPCFYEAIDTDTFSPTFGQLITYNTYSECQESAAGVAAIGANLAAIKDDAPNARAARTNLGAAKLKRALLVSANLSGASLVAADLRDANLAGANLSGADLTDGRFSGANLAGTQLDQARLDRARDLLLPN